jgi:hypothetical protein
MTALIVVTEDIEPLRMHIKNTDEIILPERINIRQENALYTQVK